MTKQKRFEKAVRENDIETVKKLLKDSEVDPAADYNYAIRYASEYGYAEVVRLLLDGVRVDPRACDNYAIRQASHNGHVEVVRLLLDDDRVNPADDNNFAIRYANEHDEIVKMLYYDYRICHQQLVLDIIEEHGQCDTKKLIERLITDKDLQVFHPDNESLHPDKKIYSLDLIKKLYNADKKIKQDFIECGFDKDLFTFISLL